MLDRLMGRGWKPSSSIATSELTEKLKRLVDSEIRESDDRRKFVPHNIKLKMQWDKFSTDAEDSLRRLETELLTALVDHINDKRYYTYAPITLEVKPDYFTDGVKLSAGFEALNEDEGETSVNVSMPGIIDTRLTQNSPIAPTQLHVTVNFNLNGTDVRKDLIFETGKRLSLGRTKNNDLAVDDISVSKMHASLMLNSEGQIVVADTGSTNGTFVDGERISYGKAVTISGESKVKFGTVKMWFEIYKTPLKDQHDLPITEIYNVGEFEFTNKTEKVKQPQSVSPAATVASIVMPESSIRKPNPTELLTPVKQSTDVKNSDDNGYPCK